MHATSSSLPKHYSLLILRNIRDTRFQSLILQSYIIHIHGEITFFTLIECDIKGTRFELILYILQNSCALTADF